MYNYFFNTKFQLYVDKFHLFEQDIQTGSLTQYSYSGDILYDNSTMNKTFKKPLSF